MKDSSFLDISNTITAMTISSVKQNKIRRKSDRQSQCRKNHLLQKDWNKSIFCYIPMAKISRSGSEVFHKRISCPVSRQNSQKSITINNDNQQMRRLTNNAVKRFEVFQRSIKQGYLKQVCQFNGCLQEKTELNDHINRLITKNQSLLTENERLKDQLATITSNIQDKNEELTKGQAKIQELRTKLQIKQTICQQLEEASLGKNKSIKKLQEVVRHLEKQINSLSKKHLHIQGTEQVQLIHELSHKLKYKEIETHMLKKEKHQMEKMEHKLSIMNKQNFILKERIKYYMRLKDRFCLEDSTSSLSLSVVSISPEKKSHKRIESQSGNKRKESCF